MENPMKEHLTSEELLTAFGRLECGKMRGGENGMAKFRFATDGQRTIIELDGKTMEDGISKVEFYHEAGEDATMKLDIDLHNFRFLPDGAFDKEESSLMAPTLNRTIGAGPIITAK